MFSFGMTSGRLLSITSKPVNRQVEQQYGSDSRDVARARATALDSTEPKGKSEGFTSSSP